MMERWTLAGGLLGLAVIAAAAAGGGGDTGLPSGTYAGTAQWRGPGGSAGTYRVERAFAGTTMSARYSWTEPQAREEQVRLTFSAKGDDPRFDVLDDQGAVVGQGYCIDGTCSYRTTRGPLEIDESFRVTGDGLAVVGSKAGPGFAVVWKETLSVR